MSDRTITKETARLCPECVKSYQEGLDVATAQEKERAASLVENLIPQTLAVSTRDLLRQIATAIRVGASKSPKPPNPS